MSKALHVVIDQEFKSEYDTDKVKTKWKLRSLSGLEFIDCTHRGYVDHTAVITAGLTGWTDFMDGKGGQIEFSEGAIGLIQPIILQDISRQIQEISSLTENERKN